MGAPKPKTSEYRGPKSDQCQTPAYAVKYLLDHVRIPEGAIWEPASGDGHITEYLTDRGFSVASGDILTGQDFYTANRPAGVGCIVTNPPYSQKPRWTARCYDLGIPFALLMPVEFMGTAGGFRLFVKHGIEILMPDKRVNFKMPNRGWDGAGAQFPTAWYTWRMGLGVPLKFARMERF